jgi:hypothetical protein
MNHFANNGKEYFKMREENNNLHNQVVFIPKI